MLAVQGVQTSEEEVPFTSWADLPEVALLAAKHYQEAGNDFWHWVVFKRIDGQAFVLDSASYLPLNIRQDFENIKPKWYIEVKHAV